MFVGKQVQSAGNLDFLFSQQEVNRKLAEAQFVHFLSLSGAVGSRKLVNNHGGSLKPMKAEENLCCGRRSWRQVCVCVFVCCVVSLIVIRISHSRMQLLSLLIGIIPTARAHKTERGL